MNVKFNVLYGRDYRLRADGPVQTQWIQCGVAWQTERGVDIKLWVVPPASLDPMSGMAVRLKLREPRPEDAPERENAPPTRAYDQEPERAIGRRRPEHRDDLDPQGQLRGVPSGRGPGQRG